MQVVYFSAELNARAPEAIGCFCTAPGAQWLTLLDIIAAVHRRETILIRPASDGEMRRAEAYVALYEVGTMLAEKMGTLLDQDEPEVMMGKVTTMREAIESVDTGPVELLDRTPGA